MSKLLDVIGKNFALKNTTKRINSTPVEIKAYLDVDTFGSIVQTVAQSSFVDGEYHAENREIARRYCIIKYLTDIDISEDEKEISVGEIFKMTQGGTWYTDIEREVTKLPIWGEVETAIDKQIDYLVAARQTTFDKLCADLSAILSVDTKADLADVKEVLKDLTKVDKDEFVDAVIKKNTKKKSAQ